MSLPLALVTGASAGIGQSFAEQLAASGHDLIVVARRRDRLEALAQRLGAEHQSKVEVLVADLASEAGIDAVAARFWEDLLVLQPSTATMYGDNRFDDRLGIVDNDLCYRLPFGYGFLDNDLWFLRLCHFCTTAPKVANPKMPTNTQRIA